MTLTLFKQIGLRHLLVALSLAPGLAIAHGISDCFPAQEHRHEHEDMDIQESTDTGRDKL